MGYSIAKMIEFALSYLLANDLMLKKTFMSEKDRKIIIDYFTKRIEQIRDEYK
jgi:hypothetical protein